ncbi:MAG: hypothetical protein E7649_06820 [Ruminococcaceae bacterium]|nr:hypothetical protein [Oscillospiraceae bacterium]
MKFKIKKSGLLISIWVILISLMAISLILMIVGLIDPRDEKTRRKDKLSELMESKRFTACMEVVEGIYDNDLFDINNIKSITYVSCYISTVNPSTGGNIPGDKGLITVFTNGGERYFLYSHNESYFSSIQALNPETLYLYKQYTNGIITEYDGYELELMILEASENGID